MESALYSIGQIAVTLVGFAALLKAFHQRNATDAHTDPRLISIVEQGLVVVLLCFLPTMFISFGLTMQTAVRLISVATSIWLLRWLYILYAVRRAELNAPIAWMYRTAVVIHAATLIVFLSAATGLIGEAEPLYFSGIILILTLVGWAFLAQFRVERS